MGIHAMYGASCCRAGGSSRFASVFRCPEDVRGGGVRGWLGVTGGGQTRVRRGEASGRGRRKRFCPHREGALAGASGGSRGGGGGGGGCSALRTHIKSQVYRKLWGLKW